jgi:putative ABC transport system ATP-binding protein
MHDAVYELRGVSRVYGRGDRTVPAVRDVDLSIARGELLAVVGPSGSGKTTLLQLLGGLDRPSSGTVLFEGRDLAAHSDGELTGLRREALGFIFQQFNLIPTLTAAQNVEAALAPAVRSRADRRTRVVMLLEAVGLAARGHHLPSRLSGGEQQRVAIARALANDPRVVLADEPTGNLDSATGAEIIGVLRALAEEDGRTVVIVTHDATVAGRADRVARMEDGRLLAREVPVVA